MEKEHVGKITTITHTLRKISRWNKVIIPQHLLQFALFFDCGTCWLCHSGLPKVNQHVACRSWMPHFPILPFAICHLKSQLLDPITPRATFVRHKFLAQENKVIRTEGGGLNHGGNRFMSTPCTYWSSDRLAEWQTNWVSYAYYANMQAKLICCGGGGSKMGAVTTRNCVSRMENKTRRMRNFNNKTHRKMYANIWHIHGRKTEGIRHTPRKQYSEVLGAKLKRNWKYII